MEYKRFGDALFARIDKGEEIFEQVKAIAIKEKISLASVQALGAVGEFDVGVFNTTEMKYISNTHKGYFEVISLLGTIDTMQGEFYCHLHMSAVNGKGEVFGGHLSRAVVSATCEMIMRIANGSLDRQHNEEVGLNLWGFGG